MVHGEHLHQSHPDLVKRLKRADGHLQNVIEMMVSGRDCADIAQQLHAVEKAVSAAKKLLQKTLETEARDNVTIVVARRTQISAS